MILKLFFVCCLTGNHGYIVSNFNLTVCTFENKPRSANKHTAEESVLNNPSRDLGAYVYPETISNDILCGWFQFRTYDNFDWTRRSGSTPSLLTGPQGDKTTGKGMCQLIRCAKLIILCLVSSI